MVEANIGDLDGNGESDLVLKKLTPQEQRIWIQHGRDALEEDTGIDPLTGDMYLRGKKIKKKLNEYRKERTFLTGSQSKKLQYNIQNDGILMNRIRAVELIPVDTFKTREEQFWRLMHSFWIQHVDDPNVSDEDFVNYVIKYG